MWVIYHKDTLLHQTVELIGAKLIPALESPARIEAILKVLEEDEENTIQYLHDKQNPDNLPFPKCEPLSHDLVQELLTKTHDFSYLEHLKTAHAAWVAQGLVEEDDCILPECFRPPTNTTGSRSEQPPEDIFARMGYYAFDMSSGLSKGSWKAILASATIAVEAARLLTVPTMVALQSPYFKIQNTVLALCRPPGHHCDTKMSGGYCYVNNAVLAVEALHHYLNGQYPGLLLIPKVAILDLDFHHGNGTQDYFYSNSAVLYVSIHGLNEFPYYSGFEEETGRDSGRGFNCNYPIPVKTSAEEYMAVLKAAMDKIQDFQPDFLIVSLGFDTFRLDPLGSFDLDTEDYETMARCVRSSDELRSIPAIIMLEGGYVFENLGENMKSFLKGWKGNVESDHAVFKLD
ncbi:histone deacetylase superfamily [Tothia fuscella]|uniref:Histone deacetylase superfamily n=1 Tax=Tothia fuscella TaxID=1048955 RepID=A0A9P4U2I4_9PEZI|nr:histone deacetylase superfamily [Tothia fuscella]